MNAPAPTLKPPPLRGPFATPLSPQGVRLTPATVGLVRTQVQALLNSVDSYHAMPESERGQIERRLTHIAAYAAECAREIWGQSEVLGQRPVIREHEERQGPIAQAAAAPPRHGGEERPGAVNQVARLTQDTIRAVAFPVFVADLIRGTFNAIIQANIQQLEQFGRLLENVTKTVDEFMADNITDNQARDWLQQRYPDHIRVKEGKAGPAEGADERPAPDLRRDLNLSGDVSFDEDSIEEKLVPAARRRLAESRLQMLSTMVLMGVNRIIVTGGKIRATMGFHIDATDRSHEEHATDLDTRAAVAGSFGFGPWSVSASTSFSYVSSTRQNSDSEIHIDTDLTGEVEIHFKSDYFPVERFANAGSIGKIQANTPNPASNPLGDAPAVGNTVEPYKSPAARPRPVNAPTLPPIGSPLPEPKTPAQPTKPVVERRVAAPKGSRWYDPKDPDNPKEGDGGEKSPSTEPAKSPEQENSAGEKPSGDKSTGDKQGDKSPAQDKAKKTETTAGAGD